MWEFKIQSKPPSELSKNPCCIWPYVPFLLILPYHALKLCEGYNHSLGNTHRKEEFKDNFNLAGSFMGNTGIKITLIYNSAFLAQLPIAESQLTFPSSPISFPQRMKVIQNIYMLVSFHWTELHMSEYKCRSFHKNPLKNDVKQILGFLFCYVLFPTEIQDHRKSLWVFIVIPVLTADTMAQPQLTVLSPHLPNFVF